MNIDEASEKIAATLLAMHERFVSPLANPIVFGKSSDVLLNSVAIEKAVTYRTKTHTQRTHCVGARDHSCGSAQAAMNRIADFQDLAVSGRLEGLQEAMLKRIDREPEKTSGQTVRMAETTESWIETCTSCRGHGEVDCSNCFGKGANACSFCSRGVTTCSNCGGSGRHPYIRPDGSYGSCSECGGHGRVRCYHCAGSGKVSCSTCFGRGILNCSPCQATGYFTYFVSAYADMVASTHVRWEEVGTPKWVDLYLQSSSKLSSEANDHVPLLATVQWRPSSFSFLDSTAFPIATVMHGDLLSAEALVFSNDEPHVCHFLGESMSPLELSEVFDSSIRSFADEVVQSGMNKPEVAKALLQSGAAKEIGQEMVAGRESAEVPKGLATKAKVFGIDAATSVRLAFDTLVKVNRNARSTIPISRLGLGSVLWTTVILMICIAIDAWVQGHIMWEAVGFGSLLRALPLILAAVEEFRADPASGGLVLSIALALASILGWFVRKFLFGAHRKTGRAASFGASVGVGCICLIALFSQIDAVILFEKDLYGQWVVPTASEIGAAAIGSIRVLPDAVLCGLLFALLRIRRSANAQNRKKVGRLESQELNSMLGY